MVFKTLFGSTRKVNASRKYLIDWEGSSKSKVQKTIFESYTDVINKGMKAGKDMSVAVKRLNHLVSEYKKMK